MTDSVDPEVVRDYEHETWSRCANDYLDGFAGLTLPAVPMLIEAAGIRAGDRILEVGCGPGHVANALGEAGAKVTGIDFSAAMIEVAKTRYPALELREADAESIPFDDAEFDGVVSSFVVHHLARPETVFGEVCRVLRPGRRFAFAVFGSPEAQSSIGAFFAAVDEHHSLDELPHGPLFGVTDEDLYGRMLRAGGLTDPKIGFREITWRVRSLDPVVRSFWSWGNMAALPREVQERIEETTRRNLEQHADGEGYSLPHQALIGSAAKP